MPDPTTADGTTLGQRIDAALARISAVAGVAMHDAGTLRDQLVADLEAIAHRIEQTSIPSDVALLKGEAAKVIAAIHALWNHGDTPAAPPAPPPGADPATHGA